MPPKGKPKALALKHSLIGQMAKNKKVISDFESQIEKQRDQIYTKRKNIEHQGNEIKEIEKELKKQEDRIRKLKRKQTHKKEKLLSLERENSSHNSQLQKYKSLQTAFSISKTKKTEQEAKTYYI